MLVVDWKKVSTTVSVPAESLKGIQSALSAGNKPIKESKDDDDKDDKKDDKKNKDDDDDIKNTKL
jgi:hypothetical protein